LPPPLCFVGSSVSQLGNMHRSEITHDVFPLLQKHMVDAVVFPQQVVLPYLH